MSIVFPKDENGFIKPSPLKISTYTMICFINNEVNLHIFSRLLNIYKEYDPITEDKKGCFISISNYNEQNHTDMPRGIVPDKLPVKVFNNQITLVYKYWGFKKINIKIFSNGKLQMTGIQDPDWETKYIGTYLINLLKTMKYQVLTKKSLISKYGKNVDYITYWDKNENKVVYRRRNISSFDIRNLMGVGLIYNYDDTKWHSDKDLDEFYKTIINFSKTHYNSMKSSKDKLLNKYEYPQEFRIRLIESLQMYNKILKLPSKYLNMDDNKFKSLITDIVDKIADIFKNYENKILKLQKTDRNFVKGINDKYQGEIQRQINIFEETGDYQDILQFDNDLTVRQFKQDKIKVELINSDFNTRFNNNLDVINTLLKDTYKIYRYYQPNNKYAGIIVKFMYNEKYLDANKYKIGKCYCPENCAFTKKKKNCTVITLSIFRPGSIIITAAKNIKQLKFTYDFINAFFRRHYKDVAYIEDGIEDYYNQNEDRKIIKKSNIYYIEKKNIQI